MTTLEDEIRDQLAKIQDDYVPSGGLGDLIEHKIRRRARVRKAQAALAVCAAVAATVFVVTRTSSQSRPSVAVGPGASTTALPPTAPPAPVTTTATSALPATAPPTRFLAGVGGGNERATIVTTATGKGRALSAVPSGQLLWALSADRRTLYAPTLGPDNCTRNYRAYDIASGRDVGEPAFNGISKLNLISPGPDGQSLAYTVCGADSQVLVGRSPGLFSTPCAAAGSACSASPIVTDRSTSPGYAVQIVWSPTGTTLAYQTGTGIEVVPLRPSTGAAHLLSAPALGCALVLPRFAGTELFAVDQCPSGATRLVVVDPNSGVLRGPAWTLSTASNTVVSDLTIDPSGAWALYAINGRVTLLPLANQAAKARTVMTGTYEVAWLPDTPPATPPTTVALPTTATTATTGHFTTTIPAAVTSVPSPSTSPVTPTPTLWIPPCSLGAPTTPYFPNGCLKPDGTIQPPP